MNYIRHLNAFFTYVKNDNRLTTSHVSLYLALFQYWNFNRFQNPFPVYRTDIMQLCKIGSKNTYHKCIKELHHCKYIFYHPAAYKYQPVKISMIRLDKQTPQNPEQLDLFSPKSGTHTSTENGTTHVPNLTDTGTENETNQVPNSGHLIKQSNYKTERETTPTHNILKKSKKIQEETNHDGCVPKSVHTGTSHSGLDPESFPKPSEIEGYFKQNNYPGAEAKKFFNHYKAIGWKIQGVTPIEDWKALVEKWMSNAAKWEGKKLPKPATNALLDIQYLYETFLEGKKIFHHITVVHFDQLQLSLSDETKQQAWTERINQVSGTNQHSLIEIWKAYLTGDPTNELVKRDQTNLIALAKRLAVINHFHNLKNQSQ